MFTDAEIESMQQELAKVFHWCSRADFGDICDV